MVRLGELLTPTLGVVDVDPAATYPMAGMLNHGRGLFRKEAVPGYETSYRTLTRLSLGQFVYSRLFAWEGSLAIVPKDFDCVFVSPEFPVFDLDDSRVLPEYLAHVARWSEFHAAVAGGRRGLGLRRQRVSPEALLKVEVPLPCLADQRRIAAHLDLVRDAVTTIETRRLRERTRAEALVASLAVQPQFGEAERRGRGWRLLPLGEVMEAATDPIDVAMDGSYPNLGIYSFGRGVFEKPPINGLATSAKKLNRVRAGEFIYSRLFAFEGAYAYVPEEFDGYFVSNEFPSFEVDSSMASARFIAAALRSPGAWTELAGSSKGLGLRRQRIKVEALLAHELWFPPVAEQSRIVAGLERLDRMSTLLDRSDVLASAIAPSALNRAFAGLA